MIALDCTGRRELLDPENVCRKQWGKIFIAELIIGTLGICFLAIGWLTLSNPLLIDKGFIMICAGGAAALSVICAEMVTLAAHYTMKVRGSE